MPQKQTPSTVRPTRPQPSQAPKIVNRGETYSILQRIEYAPNSLQPSDILHLQRAIGNRATGQLLQAKLKLGPAGDRYEQEADQVAKQVVAASHKPAVQREEGEGERLQASRYADSASDFHHSSTPVAANISRVQRTFVAPPPNFLKVQRDEMEDELQAKPLTDGTSQVQRDEEDELQAAANHGLEGGDVDADVARSIQSAKGSGQPLHDRLRSSMEQGFGADFSGVRVHTGGQADSLNRSLNARAFTTGNDIFFGKGQYNPGSSSGQELIAHELTHTVQQGAAGVQRQNSQTHGSGCSCPACAGVQRQHLPKVQRHDTEELQAKPQVRIQRASEGHGAGCGCAGCQSIQRKSVTTLQRHHEQNAFQVASRQTAQRSAAGHRHGKGCSCPGCHSVQRNSSVALQRQQTGNEGQTKTSRDSIQRTPGVAVKQRGSTDVIQRHSGYEHYMLGQIAPDDLAAIPMVRELPALRKRKAALEKELKKMTNPFSASRELADVQGKIRAATAKINEVCHTLVQEMTRLMTWRRNPEAMEGRRGEEGKVQKDQNNEWQVPVVVVPVKGDANGSQAGSDSIVVSYSEINSFPDFFGNPETIASTPKSKVLGVVQGVRQQSYIKMAEFYKELFGQDVNDLHRRVGFSEDFENATGPRARTNVPENFLGIIPTRTIVYEGQLNTATSRENDNQSEKYFAALERNACHFAPDSWDQWQAYHDRALDFARRSSAQKQYSDIFSASGNTGLADRYEKLAAELANEALLQNAFGEHYLQDSFAAGHLIDKTYIMQEFMKYLERTGVSLGSTKSAKAQWDMGMMVAKSNLTSNPQALDDAMQRNELGKVKDSAAMVGLGLDNKPEIELMMWWRHQAFENKTMKQLTPSSVANNSTAAPATVRNNTRLAKRYLDRLVAHKFAELKKTGRLGRRRRVYSLKQIHIDALKRKKGKGQGVYQPTTAFELRKDNKENYAAEAGEFNLAAYNAFLGNAFVGAATKYFHDLYCKKGLEVFTKDGTPIGHIYGDNNMMNAGGQEGVKYSAETAQWSRESVFNVINGQPEGHTTADIRKRFPARVKPEGSGSDISLANWKAGHLATDETLKKAKAKGARLLYKKQKGGGISLGKAIDVNRIAGHDGDVF
ncbi:MAG: DUF4157 domain-containing protein [Caldilineaceae bacterium]|nr:DUF4157 domain-containing protein [Caldilineaceae bacterium]